MRPRAGGLGLVGIGLPAVSWARPPGRASRRRGPALPVPATPRWSRPSTRCAPAGVTRSSHQH
eukprot:790361-Pyramimonas_sp.AAC.1